MVHFYALLSIDFKVYRLITETVSDHIIERRLQIIACVFLSFFRASEARTRNYSDSGIHAAPCAWIIAVANFSIILRTFCENEHM